MLSFKDKKNHILKPSVNTFIARSKKHSSVSHQHQSHVFCSKRHAPKISVQIQWPLKKGDFWLSSRFGPRLMSEKNGNSKIKMHHGLDMAAATGTLINPACDGRVVLASYNKGYGNYITIDHGNGVATRYAHLSSISVRSGDQVKHSDVIGKVGSTGHTRGKGDGSHLHFEVIINGRPYDPLFYLM